MPKRKKVTDRALMYFEFRPLGNEAMSVFTTFEIENEIKTLAKKLQLPKPKKDDFVITAEEWENVMTWLSPSRLGPTGEVDRFSFLAVSNDEMALTLSVLLQQILKALKIAQSCVDETGLCTGLLLPTSYAKRIEVLLGSGQLPLAWIRVLDIQSVQP